MWFLFVGFGQRWEQLCGHRCPGTALQGVRALLVAAAMSPYMPMCVSHVPVFASSALVQHDVRNVINVI